MESLATIVIPTLGTRREALDRAIASVHAQEEHTAVPLVVLNGGCYAAGLADRLSAREDIRLLHIDTPSVSAARLAGRRAVATPYYGFLDDDDELLPNALRVRIGAFDEATDLVVTNGLLREGAKEEITFPKFNPADPDRAKALLSEQWLASNGCLFATDRVGVAPFEDLPDHLEMTILAFRLALRHSIRMVNEVTFIINSSESEQVSQSWGYLRRVPEALERLEAMTERPDLKQMIRAKRAAALHQCSVNRFRQAEHLAAWTYHLRSMATGGGYRYLSYTRHLLRGRLP